MTTPRPMDSLLSHANQEASGEFICASPAAEVHVFLQRGRVAWATDSRHPFAFAAHLQDTAGIDVDTFRHIVEECRRDRLPLGETLVAWGLATPAVVRDALAYQITVALSLLARLETGQTLFLSRTYARYDLELTFALADFLGGLASPVPPAPPATPRSPSGDGDRPGLARQLRTSIEGVSWVEILDAEVPVDGDPISTTPRVPIELVRTTLLDGTDFAAIRSTRTSLLGVTLTKPRSIWCRISADSTFGTVVSALWSIAGAADKPAENPPPRPDTTDWNLGARETTRGVAIRSFLRRAPDLLGAFVLARDSAAPPIAGAGCSVLAPELGLDIARRRVHGLVRANLPLADDAERTLDSIGFSLRTMVTGEPGLWCFGAELEPDAGDTLWLFVDRRASQGLGWAYLAALTRALSCSREARS